MPFLLNRKSTPWFLTRNLAISQFLISPYISISIDQPVYSFSFITLLYGNVISNRINCGYKCFTTRRPRCGRNSRLNPQVLPQSCIFLVNLQLRMLEKKSTLQTERCVRRVTFGPLNLLSDQNYLCGKNLQRIYRTPKLSSMLLNTG